MITITNWATYQQSDEEAQHTEHHTGHYAEIENATHQTPHQTPHAATLSKEVKNLDKKYKSNSGELDSILTDHPAQPKRKFSKAEISPEIREWFEREFWPLYPRHEGKSKALEAAATKATTLEKRTFYIERLKAQLPEYCRRKQETGQRVIPMASTWFNQNRAEDELPLTVENVRKRGPALAGTDYPEYVPLSRAAL